jgi:hypothetical protein
VRESTVDRFDKIEKLHELYKRGVLSAEEYEKERARYLKTPLEILSEKVSFASEEMKDTVKIVQLSDEDRRKLPKDKVNKAHTRFFGLVISAAVLLAFLLSISS